MVAKNCAEENYNRLADLDSEVMELSLLVPAWQVAALEQAAQAEGVTVAQLLRRVISKSLAQLTLNQPGYYYG
jgi:hypothetical protein